MPELLLALEGSHAPDERHHGSVIESWGRAHAGVLRRGWNRRPAYDARDRLFHLRIEALAEDARGGVDVDRGCGGGTGCAHENGQVGRAGVPSVFGRPRLARRCGVPRAGCRSSRQRVRGGPLAGGWPQHRRESFPLRHAAASGHGRNGLAHGWRADVTDRGRQRLAKPGTLGVIADARRSRLSLHVSHRWAHEHRCGARDRCQRHRVPLARAQLAPSGVPDEGWHRRELAGAAGDSLAGARDRMLGFDVSRNRLVCG